MFLVLTSGKFLEALGSGIGTGSIFCLSFSLSNRVIGIHFRFLFIFANMAASGGQLSCPLDTGAFRNDKYLELQIIQMTEILVLYLLFGTTSCLLGTYSSSENTKRELESPCQLVVLLLLQQPVQLIELFPQSSKDNRHLPSL